LGWLFGGGGGVFAPPAAELGSLVDILEQRGTEVSFSATGERPVPPAAVRSALVDAVAPALLAARRSARVTVSAAGTGVLVGVVTDVADTDVVMVEPAGREIEVVVVGAEQQTWVEVRWSPSAS
jgi:hypothetical protein